MNTYHFDHIKEKYVTTGTHEPHLKRTREILKKHPEIRQLFGHSYWTVALAFLLVPAQFGIAYLASGQSWWVIFCLALTIGAMFNHWLNTIIHDCAHNLAFKKGWSNKLLAIFVNLPSIIPSAIPFRNWHLLHHRYQGEMGWDANLPGPLEARIFGQSTIGKFVWSLTFVVWEGVAHTMRVKKVNLWEKWTILNVALCALSASAIVLFLGAGALAYLLLSFVLCHGAPPFAGRTIQEHQVTKPNQETYSYYGPLNWVALNVGYHNEHHDFMMVPGFRLPQIRKMAPEFYEHLHSYNSWSKVWFDFIFDPSQTLYHRVIRRDHDESKLKPLTTKDTQIIQDLALKEFVPATLPHEQGLFPHQPLFQSSSEAIRASGQK